MEEYEPTAKQLSAMIVCALVCVLLFGMFMPCVSTYVHADDNDYVVDSGTMSSPTTNYSNPALVRYPSGVMATVYTKKYGVKYEVYIAFSADGGLNWDEQRITNIGDQCYRPSIALASNYDLHIVFHGLGGGANPADYSIKYIYGDYNEVTETYSYTSPVIINNDTADGWRYPEVHIAGNDSVHVVYSNDIGNNEVWHEWRDYNAVADTYGAWSAAYQVTTACASQYMFSAAIDKDDKLGVLWRNNTVGKFKLRQANGTWEATETAFNTSGVYPSLCASISGGVTRWRGLYEKTGNIIYVQKSDDGGSWSAPAGAVIAVSVDTGALSIAQTNADDVDNTGNFFAVWGDGDTNSWNYSEYDLDAGWQSRVEFNTTGDGSSLHTLKSLHPSSDYWHWSLPFAGAVVVYDTRGGDLSWGDGNESILYFETKDWWGGLPPVVVTGQPTDITKTGATFNGYHFAANNTINERGFQYGFTQVATWSTSESGTWCAGGCLDDATAAYSLSVANLTVDTIYYVRAYVIDEDNEISYGDWEGFLTSPEDYSDAGDQPDVPDDGVISDLPDEPDGWYIDPDVDVDYDESGGAGEIPGIAFFNEIFTSSGMPVAAFWYVIMCLLCVGVGYLVYNKTRHSLMVMLTVAFLLGMFASLGWVDWWLLMPYLIVGILQLVIEKDYAL